MIFWLVLIIATIFFIENRLKSKKSTHIHYFCILLFSLLSVKTCNTLLCFTLSYWLIRTIKIDRYLILKPFIVPLIIISTILLITGAFSVFSLAVVRTDFLGLVVRNFVIMTFWPILIAYTIPDIPHLRKVAYFYAVVRIIEVGITGMIIYIFYYKEIYTFITLTDLDVSISDYNNPRLFSIGAPNSNDAAFVLLGAMGLVAYRLLNHIRIMDLILTIFTFFAMLLTWSRSVWLFLILYFVIILTLNKKIKKNVVIFIGFAIFSLAIIAIQLYEGRKVNDNRLQTHDNATTRQQQMIDYISAIPNMPFFWGMYDNPKIIASKLHLRGDCSSENYILETFTRNGILAGVLIMMFLSYFVVSFWLVTKTYNTANELNKNNVTFVIAIFATYISLLLMAQSSLFRNNLILWIMIGFMSVIKQQLHIHHHEK